MPNFGPSAPFGAQAEREREPFETASNQQPLLSYDRSGLRHGLAGGLLQTLAAVPLSGSPWALWPTAPVCAVYAEAFGRAARTLNHHWGWEEAGRTELSRSRRQ